MTRPHRGWALPLLLLARFAGGAEFEFVAATGLTESSLPAEVPGRDLVWSNRSEFGHEAFLFASDEKVPFPWLSVRGSVHASAFSSTSNQEKRRLPEFGISEMLATFRPTSTGFLDVGKFRIRRGYGFLSRPTDWFHRGWKASDLRSRDLSDRLDDGVLGARVGLLHSTGMISLVGIVPDSDWIPSGNRWEHESRMAMFGSFRLGELEAELGALYGRDREACALGGNAAWSLSEIWSVHGEGSLPWETRRVLAPGDTTMQTAAPEVLVGTVWSPVEGRSLTLEYLYRNSGIASPSYYDRMAVGAERWQTSADGAIFATMTSFPDPGLARHYGFARYWHRFEAPSFDWEVYEVLNLQDGSGILGTSLGFESGSLRGRLSSRQYHGGSDAEFGLVPVRWSVGLETAILF